MVAPPAPARIRLDHAVDIYLDRVAGQAHMGSKSWATHRNYTADLHDLVDLIGSGVVVDDITGDDIDRALTGYAALPDRRRVNTVGSERAAGTKVRFWQSMHQFFEHATIHRWVQASPLLFASLKPEPPKRGTLRQSRTSMTGEQVWALLEHGAGTRPPGKVRSHECNWARDRLILSLLAVTGARVGELCAATSKDFTWREGVMQWRIVGKGGAVRVVPLSPGLVDRMRDYTQGRPQGAASPGTLILTGRGTPITPRDVQRLMGRAYARVLVAAPGLAREVTPHGLRHTCATLLMSAGWDVKVVAKLLGHASIATTGGYLDELPGELAIAIAAHPALTPTTVQSPT